MDVNIIPYEIVKASIATAKSAGKLETGEYNTNAHSYESIQSVIPRSPDSILIHRMPDMTVEHLTNWVDLIMTTRREDPANVHVFHLPPVLVSEILAAANVWVFRKREPPEMDELVSMFPRFTVAGIPTSSVFAAKEYFLRLDFCSAKDSEASNSSVDDVAGINEMLYKSRRACRALADELERRKGQPVNLFLLPFNHDIDPAREYRVFVPPSESVLLVSAISQYRWHKPFYETDRSAAMCRAREVYEGAIQISEAIFEHAETLPQQWGGAAYGDQPLWCYERLWNELVPLDQRREIVVRRM
ncbi:uncharacterized protein EV420DRAFT_1758078 [Desarmillaria tabescens]|uniref:Uncharacterized protein n=1 Tax=Armillaria tabescens TaxID=1929756 RepID=A0AA39NLI0_ARMTA|nr:uncharacterized protein EV420DRAFT_1758078 [Desarmillaria tabescens]KAK0467837.1 hypothetical protein EV420DRAFT_1758078 [Desarmillaria tabescens]